MKWKGREESDNVEDRRNIGKQVGLAAAGGGGLLIIILALVFGVDPQKLAQLTGQPQGGPVADQPEGQPAARPADPEEEEMASFTKVVLHDTEVVWEDEFRRMGKTYPKPTLVLFRDEVESACGEAESAVGPFYCPRDSKVYIDLSFYRDMQKKLNAPGEFARAYVVAHEVGHHVQRLLGYSKRADGARWTDSQAHANRMSVRLELQADFLAGVWANRAQRKFHFLEKGDIETALHAAFQIGDDRLQKKARGYVVPDSFTHGTSKQRMRWFREGFKTGDVDKARLLFELSYEEL
jgi:predicted metalloprotease